MKLPLGLIACAFCLHATTVTFNDYPNAASNPQGNFLSSGGLAFTAIRSSREGSLFLVGNPTGPPFPDFGATPVGNGTVFLVASSENNGGVIVTSPGTTFSLSTIDLNKLTQSDAALAALGPPPMRPPSTWWARCSAAEPWLPPSDWTEAQISRRSVFRPNGRIWLP